VFEERARRSSVQSNIIRILLVTVRAICVGRFEFNTPRRGAHIDTYVYFIWERENGNSIINKVIPVASRVDINFLHIYSPKIQKAGAHIYLVRTH